MLLQNLLAPPGLPKANGLVGRAGNHDASLRQNDSGPDPEAVARQLHHLAVVQPDLNILKERISQKRLNGKWYVTFVALLGCYIEESLLALVKVPKV